MYLAHLWHIYVQIRHFPVLMVLEKHYQLIKSGYKRQFGLKIIK